MHSRSTLRAVLEILVWSLHWARLVKFPPTNHLGEAWPRDRGGAKWPTSPWHGRLGIIAADVCVGVYARVRACVRVRVCARVRACSLACA
eukprot:11025090-Alexandrium_andersonii.AAC.1